MVQDFKKDKSEQEIRLVKLAKLRQTGFNPYPASVERSHTIQEIKTRFDQLEKASETVRLVGRLRSVRGHGGSSFAHLEDGSGNLQIYIKKDEVGDELYNFFEEFVDVADFVAVSGTLFVTKKGEQTVLVKDIQIIAKAVLPLPDKWHGLQDVEERYRKRYLDLIMNKEVKTRFILRSKIISAFRTLLDGKGFMEVETPTLQPIYGGGFAKPFKTHHNKFNSDYYLRISDEMYLKRLIIGGHEKIYEITKVFRNEGIDRDHNPEFTMLEAQIAYTDYHYGMDLTEEIFEYITTNVLGSSLVPYQGLGLDFKRPWKRMTMVEAIKEYTGKDVLKWQDLSKALSAAKKLDIGADKLKELVKMKKIGEIIAFIFEEVVEKKLIQPTIIYDYPVEVSPLAKKCIDPRFTQRFEIFATGFELGNNYSELNDPEDLAKRFGEEKDRAKAGFSESHQTDTEYLEAVRHGFPPTCGLGIGLDRVVMLLTDAPSIKDVIYFPTLRSKHKTTSK